MPPSPDPTGLLLCRHHYRVHLAALAAVGAAFLSAEGISSPGR